MTSDPVPVLAARAVNERSREALVEAFVTAAERCAAAEAAGDVRDGLIAMVLPFNAARRLDLDADPLVAEAAAHLKPEAAALLHGFAARGDRAELGAMKWQAVEDGEELEYRFHS